MQGGTLHLAAPTRQSRDGGTNPGAPPKGLRPLGIPGTFQAGTGSARGASRPISIAIAAATRQRKPAATKAEV